MLKRLVAIAILATSLASSAFAQTATDVNQCIQAAQDLAQAAEDKPLANDKLEKVEQLLNEMEDLCDANQVVEAMALAKDIEAAINTQ